MEKHNAVSNWEKNISKPSADDLVRLCELLGTSPNYLLLGQETVSLEEYETLQSRYNKEHEKYVALLERANFGNTTATLGDNSFNAQNIQK